MHSSLLLLRVRRVGRQADGPEPEMSGAAGVAAPSKGTGRQYRISDWPARESRAKLRNLRQSLPDDYAKAFAVDCRREFGPAHCCKSNPPRYVRLPSAGLRPIRRARPCGCGGTGRRTGFRFQRRKAWRFESSHPHQAAKPAALSDLAHKVGAQGGRTGWAHKVPAER
jgi:hypothetical protein